MRLRPVLLLGFVLAVRVVAQVPSDVIAAITDAADALTNDDASAFLEHFDRNMPGFATLRMNVEGLLGANQVASTVEPVSSQGDNREQSVELDWLLAIDAKDQLGMRKETRRSIVKCRLVQQGGRWKIVALEPLDFFRP